MNEFDEYLEEVPKGWRDRCTVIMALTDGFCKAHLNEEYVLLCREMATCLCQNGSPADRGKPQSWASGIVYAVGRVNFLTDPSQSPHMAANAIAKEFGVAPGTMMAKAKILREGLGLVPFHPDWCLPSRLGQNPLAWMHEVDGMIVDFRHVPREVQQAALEQGLIPYIPGDEEDAPPLDAATAMTDDGGDVEARIINFESAVSGGRSTRSHRESSAGHRAQQLAYDAMNAVDPDEAFDLASKAFKQDSQCVDAMVMLAQLGAETPEELVTKLEKAVAVGRSALGEAFFRENRGYFWGLLETRPYMRGRHLLAMALWKVNRRDEAIAHYEEMLRLNPNDNQGIRELLLGAYLTTSNLEGARDLFDRYVEDERALFRWGRLLERILAEDLGTARRLLEEAREDNVWVENYLTGRKSLPSASPNFYSPGEESEAVLVGTILGPAWQQHCPALTWLKAQP